MSDFCKQCSEDLGFPDNDMRNLSSEFDDASGLYPIVLCEGCGPIQVDSSGSCISEDCFKKHGVMSRGLHEIDHG